jgi:hypothetical protein
MKRRDFLKGTGVTISFAVMPAIPKRGDFLALNENFKQVSSKTGIVLEMVDCGKYPNDGTADSMREAMMKVNRNFEKIAAWVNGSMT